MKKLIGTIFGLIFIVNVSFSQDAEFTNGKSKLKAGDYKGAAEDFTKAIQLNPKDMNYYLQRGMAYGLLEDYESAIKDYTTVITAEPKHIFAYISRGGAYNKTKKYEKALTDFNKAIEIDPENTEAYNNRGWAKKFLGDKKGACKDWKESKKKGNDEARIILKNNDC
ncbi:MAG: tetratricopeptide repeat protein [Bacteroidia bacterium]|nr:tetratricopeptide repeat protein [Bacteroidia bacterium]